jgi:benzoyl-CoA reductase subunit C
MDLESIVARVEELYHDIDLECVASWRRKTGGKAVGFMPIYVPRELLHAAGVLPVGIVGGGDKIEIIRGDAYFQSYICQIPRSTIELALSGRLDQLDGMLFPSICDVIRNMSGMWKLLFKDKYVRYFDMPQNFDPEVGGKFYSHDLRTLVADMEELSGNKVTDDELWASIRVYNDNRLAVAELMALRIEEPWRTSAYESYLVLHAGNVLPVEEHTELVRDFVKACLAAHRPLRDNARMLVTGAFCERPPAALIKTLEMAGCYILWDDMNLVQRWFPKPIEEGGDPIVALSNAFLRDSEATASVYKAKGQKGEELIETVKRTRAEGVIFAAPSFCDPALLDQPMLQDALDREGVPWTAFRYAENLGQFQVIREQAGTFADSIKLWSEA